MNTGIQDQNSASSLAGARLIVRSATKHVPLSLLALCAGLLFSGRTVFVLITARWFNAGTEPGVLMGFAMAAALGLSASLSTFRIRTHARSGTRPCPPIRWVTLFLVFSGFSMFWTASASVASSAIYWLSLAGDVAIVILLARGTDQEQVLHSLLKGFISGSCALAVVAWIMPAAIDLRLGDVDFFNTNQIGNLCALSVLMCSLLASRGDALWSGLPLFLALTLFRSLSKATLIAFTACLLYRLVRDISISRGRKWLLSSGAFVLILGSWGLLSAYYDAYTTTGNQAETLTGRTAIWAWTVDAALRKPLFGNGFDAMWKVAPPFGGELFEARHAENELLQQFFAYGVCGVVLLVGIYGSLYQRFRALPRGPERTALTAFLIFVVIRGLAEAEPFDLLLPLWLVAAFALLPPRGAPQQTSFHSEPAPEAGRKVFSAC